MAHFIALCHRVKETVDRYIVERPSRSSLRELMLLNMYTLTRCFLNHHSATKVPFGGIVTLPLASFVRH